MRSLRAILVALLTVVAALAMASPVLAEWPTTCVDLNDIVEAHLGNDENVGICQRVFFDQAEQGCQNDHRDDVRGVFAWAFGRAAEATEPEAPDLAWPSDCVELNDIVEASLGDDGNVGIYQGTVGAEAEAACRNDHRGDARGTFARGVRARYGQRQRTTAVLRRARRAVSSGRSVHPHRRRWMLKRVCRDGGWLPGDR